MGYRRQQRRGQLRARRSRRWRLGCACYPCARAVLTFSRPREWCDAGTWAAPPPACGGRRGPVRRGTTPTTELGPGRPVGERQRAQLPGKLSAGKAGRAHEWEEPPVAARYTARGTTRRSWVLPTFCGGVQVGDGTLTETKVLSTLGSAMDDSHTRHSRIMPFRNCMETKVISKCVGT